MELPFTGAISSGATVPLELASNPSGAEVWLDGSEQGSTPLDGPVEPGACNALKVGDSADGQYAVGVGGKPAALHALRWRRHPALTRLLATRLVEGWGSAQHLLEREGEL